MRHLEGVHKVSEGAAPPEKARSHDAAVLAAAQDIIADVCRYRPEQAFDALLDAAQHYHLSAVQLARGLLELIGDVPRISDELRGPPKAAFQQWGRLLVDRVDLTRLVKGANRAPGTLRPGASRIRESEIGETSSNAG